MRVLNAMVSASPAMIGELRKLRSLLEVLGVSIESRWIPSAVNKFSDSLSRTWLPDDMRAYDHLEGEPMAHDRLASRASWPPLNEPNPKWWAEMAVFRPRSRRSSTD